MSNRRKPLRHLARLKQYPKLEKAVYLYVLIDPENGQVRYVGQTNDPIYRMRCHLQTMLGWATPGTKRAWLSGLYFRDLIPHMQIVAIVEPVMAEAQEVALINAYADSGADLFNKVRRQRGSK